MKRTGSSWYAFDYPFFSLKFYNFKPLLPYLIQFSFLYAGWTGLWNPIKRQHSLHINTPWWIINNKIRNKKCLNKFWIDIHFNLNGLFFESSTFTFLFICNLVQSRLEEFTLFCVCVHFRLNKISENYLLAIVTINISVMAFYNLQKKVWLLLLLLLFVGARFSVVLVGCMFSFILKVLSISQLLPQYSLQFNPFWFIVDASIVLTNCLNLNFY